LLVFLPLLDFLRQEQQLTGTHAACREGDCGSCLVLCGEIKQREIKHADDIEYSQNTIQYRPLNSCLLPMGLIQGQHIVTIEGINGPDLNPVQNALVVQGGIQCGFCTAGLVMSITAFFLNAPRSDEALAIDAVSGNICRCTGYAGIKRALSALCQQFKLEDSSPESRIQDLITWQILPAWFADIPQRLLQLHLSDSAVDKSKVNLAEAEQAIFVAGGTDLWVRKASWLKQQNLDFITLDRFIVNDVDHSSNNLINKDLNEKIEATSQSCLISAATRIESLRLSPVMQQLFRQIEEDFKLICSTPVRQQATVGGNIVNASPIADLSIFFLALDASLILKSVHGHDEHGQRVVPLRDFFKGYKKIDLHSDEQLLNIRFCYTKKPLRFSFEKVSKRTYLDIASVNSAMLIELQADVITKIHISAGGVAAIPLYLQQSCQFLQGKRVTIEVINQALSIAQSEISPIADIRGSVAYKRLLLRQLLIAHFSKLLAEFLSWEDFQ